MRLSVQAASELLGIAIAAVQPIEHDGISHVSVMTTGEGARIVVKYPPEQWHWTVEKETYVYELLRSSNAQVPIPRVLATNRPGVLALELLPGETPTDVETGELYRQIGALLAQFHDLQFDAFGYIGTSGILEPRATNGDYMRHQFEKKLREHAAHGGDANVGARIAGYVSERAQLIDGCESARLCHNDCHEGNLVAQHGRISGVFDVQNAVAADPLLDLAKTAYYSRRNDKEHVVEALAEGHGGLRDDWRDALDLYVLYHQLELWDWFASIGTAKYLAAIEDEMRQATRKTD